VLSSLLVRGHMHLAVIAPGDLCASSRLDAMVDPSVRGCVPRSSVKSSRSHQGGPRVLQPFVLGRLHARAVGVSWIAHELMTFA